MTIRNSVLLNMIGFSLGTVAVIFGLHYLFGDWGIIIFWSGILAYLLRQMYLMKVDQAMREQQEIIDQLKK
jgi:hypothetical protein